MGSEMCIRDRGSETTELTPRNGDLPALQVTAPDRDGLLIFVHQTAPSNLTYRTWEKFLKFATHKDFKDIQSRHEARGLPREGFAESYVRYAKSLIAIGDGNGADQETGVDIEFVATTNPYGANFNREFSARLLYQGQPRGDAQVEVLSLIHI